MKSRPNLHRRNGKPPVRHPVRHPGVAVISSETEMRLPRDSTPYPQHSKSRPINLEIEDGSYVYVVDEFEVVWVLRDGPHRHPRVLGGGRSATYAGDLRIENGVVVELTNLSGTFLFDEIDGLLEVAHLLRRIGLEISAGAVRYFPADGRRPQKLE